jgi:hypothetical protein
MLYLCYLYLFTYTQFPYQMMFVSLNLSTTGVSSRTGTSYPSGTSEFTPGFKWCTCCSIFSFLGNIL